MAEMSDSDLDMMQLWREEYQADRDRDKIDRSEAQDDNAFVYSSDATVRNPDGVGSQWSDIAFKQRKEFNRPVMQWNRMHIYQQYVVNQARQNDFGIQVIQGDKGSAETAEMLQDRMRQIEYESNASTVYDISREAQCSSGRGFYRISTEFIKGTWRQRIKLDEIPDQFSVLWGPGKEYDRSDAERCTIMLPLMTKAQYRRKWGQAKLDRATTFASDYDLTDWWDIGKSGDMVQVCERFCKEFSKHKLYLLADGVTTVSEDEIDTKNIEALAEAGYFLLDDDGVPTERDEETFEVWRYIFDGAQILDKEKFAIDEIPIVPVWGLCAVVLGAQRQYSLGNRAKDCQRAVNLCVSNLMGEVGAQIRSKFLVEIEQVDPKFFDDYAGKTNASLLFYSRFSQTLDRADLGIPQIVEQEPKIAAALEALQAAIEALKAAHGIYDASLGARSNETSRVAIDARKQQAEVVNYHFLGNEARSRKRGAQIIIKLISVIEADAQQVTVRNRAGKTRVVPIGVEHKDPKTGQMVKHVLSDVDYGVQVKMGPNFDSQMEQVHETDKDLMNSNLAPEMKLALTPEMLRTQNAPNSEERAEIAEAVVNKLLPGVLPEDEQAQQPNPQQLMQKIQELGQQLQQAQAHAQSLFEQQQTEQVKRDSDEKLKKMEDETKRWTVTQQETTKRVLGLVKVDSEEAKLVLEQELNITHKKTDLAAQAAGTAADQQHEASEAQAARDHASNEAEAGRAFQSEESEASRVHEAVQSDVARQHEASESEAARKAAVKTA